MTDLIEAIQQRPTPTPETDVVDELASNLDFRAEDEFDTAIALARSLEQRLAAATEALQRIRNELGVPQPGYIQPVANASDIAAETLSALARMKEGKDA